MSPSLRSLCALYMGARNEAEERQALCSTLSTGPHGCPREPVWLLLATQALRAGAHAEHVMAGREGLLDDLPNLLAAVHLAVEESIRAEDARDQATPLAEVWSTPGGVLDPDHAIPPESPEWGEESA